MRWLTENLLSRKRRAPRTEAPELVAYYWTGGTPVRHRVRDFSNSGLYLLTEDRWYVGTMLLIMLQEENQDRSIRVQSRVVRSGDDGVAFQFLFSGEGHDLAGGVEQKELLRFAESICRKP